MMNKPFQRKGAESNTQVGRDFESNACAFLSTQGMQLRPGLAVEIGINVHKPHKFDLGDPEKKVIVECKAHRWTEGGNVPSAKMTAWNQAMFFFYAAPADYRKILFVLRDFSQTRAETLGQYYIRTNPHLIPKDVEIWEFDERNGTAERIK
jgi:hypothetical protein